MQPIGSSKIPREIQKDTLNSTVVYLTFLLLYEVFAVLLRHTHKHVFLFVFHHCDIIQLGCFDSIVLFVNIILTYSLGFHINLCRVN